MAAGLKIIRSAEGIATAQEAWLNELVEPDKGERARERESQEYARWLAEANYERLIEIANTRRLLETALRLREELAQREREQTREAANAGVQQQFEAVAQQWLLETKLLSDPVRQYLHPLHLKIIAMGEKILPLVLREVEKQSGHWFVVLNAISPENPVKPEDETSIERVTNAWLEWGKEKGLI